MTDPALQGSALIGPIGGLIRLHGSSSVDMSRPERVRTRKAGSGRITAQVFPASGRQWDVSVDTAYPEHMAPVRQLEASTFGPGPHVFYDEDAQAANILTPKQTSLTAGTWTGGAFGGGGIASDDTIYMESLTGRTDSAFRMVDPAPVPALTTITTATYISTHPAQSAQLRVTELDIEGATVGVPHMATVPANTHARRAAATFPTSVRTVAVRLEVLGGLITTLPSITFTPEALPWADGAGCTTGLLTLLGHSVKKAVPAAGGRRRSYTMTIHELG